MTDTEITKVFCDVDDFVQILEREMGPRLLKSPGCQRNRGTRLSLSEAMTILILFHRSGYRTFKDFYTKHVRRFWKHLFPGILSYTRFLHLIPRTLLPLCAFLHSRFGKQTGIAFIDSTKLAVCHPKRIRRNKVFDGIAKIGKTTMGWFYGLKCHLVINDRGELLAVHITAGNVDDRKPVDDMTRGLFGKLFGDKGYISGQLFETLFERGLQLVTHIRDNMKNRLMPIVDKILLRKRSLIETVNDQLTEQFHIETNHAHSFWGLCARLYTKLTAHTLCIYINRLLGKPNFLQIKALAFPI